MSFRFWPNRLSVKLTLLNLLVFGGFSIAVLLVTGQVFQRAVAVSIEQNAKQISQLLNLSLSLPSATGDYEAVRIFFDELLSDPSTSDLSYLLLIAPDDSLLLGAGQYPLPIPEPSQHLPTSPNDSLYHVRQPILLEDNQIGYVQFGLRVDGPIQANLESRQRIALLLLAGSASLAVIVALFARRFTRQLKHLMDATRELADGNFRYQINISSNDELATLGQRFNQMADTINQKVNALLDIQRELAELNLKLELRVQARTKELEEKNTDLESTLQALKAARTQLVESEKLSSLGSLVAGVSHELNTPVGNAVMVSTTLLDDVKQFRQRYQDGIKRSELDAFVESVNHASDIVHRNLVRASELVRSFKRVAIDQTSAQRRQFDLQAMIRELINTLSPSFKRLPITVEQNVPSGLSLDSYPGPLGQVIANLVNNAITHAFDEQQQGRITVHARALDSPANHIELIIKDDGIGMAPEDLKRIFEPFFTTKLGRGGSGLGMVIVYTLVTGLLGGQIRVESELRKGMRIIMRLPRQAPIAKDEP